MEASLPKGLIFAWGVALTVGALLTLVGSFSNQKLKGLLVEQIGLALVGVAAVLYACVALVTLGFSSGAGVPAAIVGAFGLSCLWRWVQIQRFIKSVADAAEAYRKREQM
jgi:hypothetical protein